MLKQQSQHSKYKFNNKTNVQKDELSVLDYMEKNVINGLVERNLLIKNWTEETKRLLDSSLPESFQ